MINQNALKQIETLHRMKQEGVITEEDFEKSKAKILHGGSARQPTSPAATMAMRLFCSFRSPMAWIAN